ncbi:glycosyltransferase, partial [Liquorilactobacillus sp.]
MATYNGEKYIEEQINSILKQTKQIDELVICDDKSSDSTVQIIDSFNCDL